MCIGVPCRVLAVGEDIHCLRRLKYVVSGAM